MGTGFYYENLEILSLGGLKSFTGTVISSNEGNWIEMTMDGIFRTMKGRYRRRKVIKCSWSWLTGLSMREESEEYFERIK